MVPSEKPEPSTRPYSHPRDQVTFKQEQMLNTPAWRLTDRTQLRCRLSGLLQHRAKSTALVIGYPQGPGLAASPCCPLPTAIPTPLPPALPPPRHRSASRRGAVPGRAPHNHPRAPLTAAGRRPGGRHVPARPARLLPASAPAGPTAEGPRPARSSRPALPLPPRPFRPALPPLPPGRRPPPPS